MFIYIYDKILPFTEFIFYKKQQIRQKTLIQKYTDFIKKIQQRDKEMNNTDVVFFR